MVIEAVIELPFTTYAMGVNESDPLTSGVPAGLPAVSMIQIAEFAFALVHESVVERPETIALGSALTVHAGTDAWAFVVGVLLDCPEIDCHKVRDIASDDD